MYITIIRISSIEEINLQFWNIDNIYDNFVKIVIKDCGKLSTLLYDENFEIYVAKTNCPTDVKVAICEIQLQLPCSILFAVAYGNDCSTCSGALISSHLHYNTE